MKISKVTKLPFSTAPGEVSVLVILSSALIGVGEGGIYGGIGVFVGEAVLEGVGVSVGVGVAEAVWVAVGVRLGLGVLLSSWVGQNHP